MAILINFDDPSYVSQSHYHIEFANSITSSTPSVTHNSEAFPTIPTHFQEHCACKDHV